MAINRAEVARLKLLAKSKAGLTSADPYASMTIAELNAELAKLDDQLIELGAGQEEPDTISVGYWLSKGYSQINAETLSRYS